MTRTTTRQIVTITIDEQARTAEAEFDDHDYPEPYRIWLTALDPAFVDTDDALEDGRLPAFRLDDSSDADDPEFATWDDAVRAFRQAVADQVVLDGEREYA